MDGDNAFEMIGRVTVAWNRIEWLWDDLFFVMLDAPRQQAAAIYYAPANFGAQRSMVLALADLHLAAKHPVILQELRKLHGDIGKAAGDRNAAVHSRYAASEISNTLSVISTGKYDLSDELLTQQLSDSVASFNALFDRSWLNLAKICAALGRDMPL